MYDHEQFSNPNQVILTGSSVIAYLILSRYSIQTFLPDARYWIIAPVSFCAS